MSNSVWNTDRWGTFVVATRSAVTQGIADEGQRGVLLGIQGQLCKVVKENTTTSTIYAMSFWYPTSPPTQDDE